MGCNTNPFIHKELIKRYGQKNVFGIDLHTNNIKDLKNIFVGDANNLSKIFKDKKVDSIFAGEIIEHLDNPLIFLDSCFKQLNNEGILVITTSNITSFKYCLSSIIKTNNASKEPEHIYAWDLILLERLIRKAGFSVLEKGYIKSRGGVGILIPFERLS